MDINALPYVVQLEIFFSLPEVIMILDNRVFEKWISAKCGVITIKICGNGVFKKLFV